jgi:hypothetical protein
MVCAYGGYAQGKGSGGSRYFLVNIQAATAPIAVPAMALTRTLSKAGPSPRPTIRPAVMHSAKVPCLLCFFFLDIAVKSSRQWLSQTARWRADQ